MDSDGLDLLWYSSVHGRCLRGKSRQFDFSRCDSQSSFADWALHGSCRIPVSVSAYPLKRNYGFAHTIISLQLSLVAGDRIPRKRPWNTDWKLLKIWYSGPLGLIFQQVIGNMRDI